MNKLFPYIIGMFVAVALLFAPAVYAYNPVPTQTCANAPQSTLCSDQTPPTTNPLTGPNGLLRVIANVMASLAGLVAVVIIITGGFKYITSGGDPSQIKSAQGTIISAIIGLIIIILADSIIGFVISKV
jgi:hypothetical protein